MPDTLKVVIDQPIPKDILLKCHVAVLYDNQNQLKVVKLKEILLDGTLCFSLDVEPDGIRIVTENGKLIAQIQMGKESLRVCKPYISFFVPHGKSDEYIQCVCMTPARERLHQLELAEGIICGPIIEQSQQKEMLIGLGELYTWTVEWVKDNLYV